MMSTTRGIEDKPIDWSGLRSQKPARNPPFPECSDYEKWHRPGWFEPLNPHNTGDPRNQ